MSENIPFDREAHPDPKDWPAVWKRKDEISSALLAELGYPVSEYRILMRNAPARGELEVDGDVVVLLVCVLNERGGLHLQRSESGETDAVHEVVRVPVSAERLARYRADLDEAEACCDDENYDTCQCKHHEAAGDPVVEDE